MSSLRASGIRVAVWREPRVWTVRLRERYDAKPRRMRLPMPGFVFVCLPGRQAPYVFAAKPEFEQVSRNRLGEHTNASLAVSAGDIFIRTDSHLWCIGGAKK